VSFVVLTFSGKCRISFTKTPDLFYHILVFTFQGHRGRDRIVVVFIILVQSVPITTKVVSSNPVHGEVYSIQHYVIKFVSDLLKDQWFSLGSAVSSNNKTDHHDIAEILLKVALNSINLTQTEYLWDGCSKSSFNHIER
jgi:hypothetical protein